ncbi:MAG: DUF1523 family protein [Rhodobacteraceae bacterium]|nr:DUF1523 family protein [Paracoccaceae bacterium]
MRYVKWTFRILVLAIVGGFLIYTLPSNDVVRIVGSEVRRVEIGPNAIFWAGAEPTDKNAQNRDIKFISAVYESGRTRVYRNEDTGWGWPPYFKFDSADVQAQAANLTSNQSAPVWVQVRYYGIRSNLFSIYPNVLSMKKVAGPDVTIVPYTKIGIVAALVALVLFVRWSLKWFWRNRVDPIVDDVASAFETADDRAEARMSAARTRFRGRRERFREWWVELFG